MEVRCKMRAECAADVARFIRAVNVSFISASRFNDSFPDMEVEFTSSLCLNQVREALRSIEDGHVMLETVELWGRYTGERKAV